jgi:5-methylthioribose kinase
MNVVLRVATNKRSVIVKQSRPYVAKYPQIEAPWNRAEVEYLFYQQARQDPFLAQQLACPLLFDAEQMVLVFEDLGAAADCTFVYRGELLTAAELDQLTSFLRALHGIRGGERIDNREMRRLNHEHIFLIPFQIELPHLAGTARALGDVYLSDGPCLLHGDFFPGSWLRTPAGLVMIDPEFAFHGPPEWDWGVMLAHLVLGSAAAPPDLPADGLDRGLMLRFAGVEVLRRIYGVAKLPLRDEPERLRFWTAWGTKALEGEAWR